MKPCCSCVLLLIVGCSSENATNFPVSGSVKLHGKSLETGNIQFMTSQGPAGGAVITDGIYEIPKEHGLQVGKYRVMINSSEPIKDTIGPKMSFPKTREKIPPSYNEKSDVHIEVKSNGTNQFDFLID